MRYEVTADVTKCYTFEVDADSKEDAATVAESFIKMGHIPFASSSTLMEWTIAEVLTPEEVAAQEALDRV